MSTMSLDFVLLSPPQMPAAPGTQVSFSFNLDPTAAYTLYYGQTSEPVSKSPVTCVLPSSTTTFILQATKGGQTRQESITIPVAGGAILLQTINVTQNGYQGQQWIPFALPSQQFSRFQLTFDCFEPTNAQSLAIAQLQFQPNGSGYQGGGYCGTGWGNDSGGNGFFEYYGTGYLNFCPLGRGGPVAGSGISGTVDILNTSISGAFSCIVANIIAPTAFNSLPMAGHTASYCSAQSGAPTGIQIGYGLFNGSNTPSTMDTVNRGIIRLYGLN